MICQRGHSPPSNQIILCDGCNAAYHMYCHDPTIHEDFATQLDKAWFCGKCKSEKENANLGIGGRVSGEGLTQEEKQRYLSSLTPDTLRSLLLHACTIHPSLPIFPPNTHQTLQSPSETFPQPRHPAMPNSLNSIPYTLPPLSASVPSITSQQNISSRPEPAPPPPRTVPGYGYQHDPPAHYPRPGQGLMAKLPHEHHDLQWMVDDNYHAFNHLYRVNNGPQDGHHPYGYYEAGLNNLPTYARVDPSHYTSHGAPTDGPR